MLATMRAERGGDDERRQRVEPAGGDEGDGDDDGDEGEARQPRRTPTGPAGAGRASSVGGGHGASGEHVSIVRRRRAPAERAPCAMAT